MFLKELLNREGHNRPKEKEKGIPGTRNKLSKSGKGGLAAVSRSVGPGAEEGGEEGGSR